tara:strand:- start:23 stop:799 length:777 start_codon:yes stop_codon:yes gene_type:complete
MADINNTNNKKVFQKIGPPEILYIEYLKSKAASKLGRNTNLYEVPKVKNYNINDGIIEFEYIEDLNTIYDLMSIKSVHLPKIVKQLGITLASIHNDFALPKKYKNNLPIEWMDIAKDNVFIHGDFTLRNTCFHTPSKKLYILDWSTTPLMNQQWTFGTRHFDILWFIRSIYIDSPNKIFSPRYIRNLANLFLKGYLEYQHSNIDVKSFSRCQVRLVRQYNSIIVNQFFESALLEKLKFLKYFFITYPHWRLYKPSYSH